MELTIKLLPSFCHCYCEIIKISLDLPLALLVKFLAWLLSKRKKKYQVLFTFFFPWNNYFFFLLYIAFINKVPYKSARAVASMRQDRKHLACQSFLPQFKTIYYCQLRNNSQIAFTKTNLGKNSNDSKGQIVQIKINVCQVQKFSKCGWNVGT